MSTCGLAHLYSDAICGLPAGHEMQPAGEVHRDGDTRWLHHEEEIGVDAAGEVIYDVWDERV